MSSMIDIASGRWGIVAYRVNRSALIIVRVLHGARDFRKLF
jgi:plasmid stabilization system protein ParE